MTTWLLVALVVACTVLGDLLQSFEMKRHGEISGFTPSGIGRHFAVLARKKYLILAVFFMAISFFAFMKLVTVAEFSLAVPASAASVALETVAARLILKERVNWLRWVGACLVVAGVVLLGR